jgi:hypothetical protein
MLKPKYEDISEGNQLRLDFGDLLFIISGAVEAIEAEGIRHPYLEMIRRAGAQAQAEISYWVARLDGADQSTQVQALVEAYHARE